VAPRDRGYCFGYNVEQFLSPKIAKEGSDSDRHGLLILVMLNTQTPLVILITVLTLPLCTDNRRNSLIITT
jgi:hypothetical protein